MLAAQDDGAETVAVDQNGTFIFPHDLETVKIGVKWVSKQAGVIADLDLNAYLYDERARFSEKVDPTSRISKDDSIVLRREQGEIGTSGYMETIKLDFRIVNPKTSAIVLYLDGGPRNFQFLQSVTMECHRILPERAYGDFLPSEDNGDGKKGPVFTIQARTRKSYKGLALCAFYKDGWNQEASCPIWTMRAFLEPLFVASMKEKQDRCTQLIINSVPSLDKFRPRLFTSIRDICAALSSHSLPKLKKKFLRNADGLPIGQFTEVIFKQLYETFPKIIEESEAPYTVAMVQEMFQQIDFNGDGSTNWDEFTTFCVQTGLGSTSSGGGSNPSAGAKRGGEGSNTNVLDQYIIEYGEEVLQRDHLLSAYRYVSVMRHVSESHRLLIISEDADYILVTDEKFRMITQLYPSKVQVIGSYNTGNGSVGPGRSDTAVETTIKAMKTSNIARVMIYDVLFLPGRDLYAYTASDHSITVCKEQTSMGGTRTTFLQHNRFFHTLLHLKLCWSQKHSLLCSTASDRTIYGWNIDTAQILFQVSRHSDIITDFIAADHLDVFITCSMDKRIVMWSATSRRVKGILLGHKRGVRCLSVYENTLLSAGFECEAKTWDLINKDCVALLKGHRHPISAAKLMCDKAQTEKEYRAITVDEFGEFRVWNIYVREKSSDPVPVPTLQIFEMQNGEYPMNQFRFLALPYNPRSSTSYYSNLIACSTKLIHFLPEKNTREFIPPMACVCNESSAALVTAVGRSVLTYDLSHGQFSTIFEGIGTSDISAICFDGERGRRMFLGTAKGEIMLINSISGTVIHSLHYHQKDITTIVQRRDIRNCVYSCALDGHIRMYEENGGKLSLNSSVDNVFGEGVGLSTLKLVPSLHVLVVSSVQKSWGLLHDSTFKKIFVVHEEEVITALEVIGASHDKEHEDMIARNPDTLAHSKKESMVTIAVALARGVVVYCVDVLDLRGVKVFELTHDSHLNNSNFPLYITDMCVLRNPDQTSVNYSSVRARQSTGEGSQLIAVIDDGRFIIWDRDSLRMESENKYRLHHAAFHANKPRHARSPAAGGGNRSPSLSPERLANNNSSSIAESDDNVFLTATTPATRSLPSRRRGKIPGTAGGSQKTWLEASSAELFPLAQQLAPATSPTAASSGSNVATGTIAGSPRKKMLATMDHIVRSGKCINAHTDLIPAVAALPTNNCFVTVSHDGFHRVWNLDGELLGELQLPNISEQMKAGTMCKEPGTQWKFILERIPVTKVHQEVAALLVKSIRATKAEKMLDFHNHNEQLRRHNTMPFNFKGFRDFEESENSDQSEQARSRKMMLKSLAEAPKISEEHPPTRLPTKEEKELIKLAFTSDLNTHSMTSTSPGFGLSQSMSSLAPLKLTSSPPGSAERKKHIRPSVQQRSAASLSSSPHHNKSQSTLRSSLLFGGDSNVCMSSFGVPSLWIVPGEKDIFGRSVMQVNTDAPEQAVAPAFSDASIAMLERDNMIDLEGRKILRQVAANIDRVQVYDRSQPTLLIRNSAMSTTVTLPPIDTVRKTEIYFGAQKDMYKNAERVLDEKGDMSRSTIRGAVALSRIDHNVRRVSSMIHLIQPPSHDEVILPKNATVLSNDKRTGGNIIAEDSDYVYSSNPNGQSDEAAMKMRLAKSERAVPLEAKMKQRTLDRSSIDRWMGKMNDALDGGIDNVLKAGDAFRRRTKKKETVSPVMVAALEKKLLIAIKSKFRARLAKLKKLRPQEAAALMADEADDGLDELLDLPAPKATARKHVTLTTRDLLPYYKLDAVIQFMDIFAKVDENFSGDLDVNEWIRLFTSLNEAVPVQEARMIFMKIDKDADGFLSMRELIPVVFNKASRIQQKRIIEYCEMELMKKIETETIPTVTATDLEFLFEAYDSDNVGFIEVNVVRERVKKMNLTNPQLFFFADLISDLADDEMVNFTEFKRMFKIFTSKG